MKILLLITTSLLCVVATAKAQVEQAPYTTKTRIINGYVVGKSPNDIALTSMTLKIQYKERAHNSFGAVRNVKVIASSQNGIDFIPLSPPKACNISEEWSNYMSHRTGYPDSYYITSPWKSGESQQIDNYFIFRRWAI